MDEREDERSHPFVWFDDIEEHGERGTLTLLVEQLQAAGPGRRLEIRTRRDGSTWLHVVADDTSVVTTFEPLNKSHNCPPTCP